MFHDRKVKFWVRILAPIFAAGLLLVAAGCGGGSSQTVQPLSAVQIKLHDAPADNVVAFEITVNSVVLTDSNGNSVSVLPSPAEIELAHLAGTMEPLALSNIPQGTYSSAVITVASPEATFINPATGQLMEKNATLASNTATITFNPALTLGNGVTSINFDFNLANSVSIDASNNVSVTPSFTVATATVAAEDAQHEDDGEIEDMAGAVASVSANSFSISTLQNSQQLTFAVNSSTQFDGIGSLSALTKGMIVQVNAVTQPDNSLLAKSVEVEVDSSDGLEAAGLVTQVSGSPATQFSMVVQDEAASSPMAPPLGSPLTVSITSATTFGMNSDNVDVSNLPFTPLFDATTLSKGQSVEADDTTASNGTVTASQVKLHSQALVGTVSAYAQSGQQAQFVLTLSANSAFALLTGSNTVTVFQQAGTELSEGVAVANGSTVRVRGLLFLDAGSYKLVAGKIGMP